MAETSVKIIAHAAGLDKVVPGEIVTCSVDLNDPRLWGSAPGKAILEKLGVGVWDPDKVVLISDHYVPAVDAESAQILDVTRKFATEQGLPHFYDMQGICHVVLAERGHLKPGMFVVGR